MNIIKSADNGLVKQAASLKNAKSVRECGLFLAEGAHLAGEALRSEVKIKCAFAEIPDSALKRESCEVYDFEKAEIRELARGLLEVCVPLYGVPKRLMEKMCDAKTPQGILLLVEIPQVCEDFLNADGAYLLLENIQDPGNVGNMLRTAESFGFSGVVLCGAAPELFSPKAVRGSMGSVFRMPTIKTADISAAVQLLHEKKIMLCSAELSENSITPNELPQTGICIAIGNEGKGVSPELSALADITVKIPMSGKTESLSAPSAAAVLMWENFKKRSAL